MPRVASEEHHPSIVAQHKNTKETAYTAKPRYKNLKNQT